MRYLYDIYDPYVFIFLSVIPMGDEEEPLWDLEDFEVFEMDGWYVGRTWVPISKLFKIGLCQGIQYYGACYSKRCYFTSFRNGSTVVPESRWGNVDCNPNMNLHFAGYGRCVEEQRELRRRQEEEQAQEAGCRQWVRDGLWDEENTREQLLKGIEAMKQEACSENDKALAQEQEEDTKTSEEEPLDDTKHGKMVEVSTLEQLQTLMTSKKKKAPAKKAPKKAAQKSSQYRVTKKANKKQPKKRQTQTDPPASDVYTSVL
jgi:hypothetical protein